MIVDLPARESFSFADIEGLGMPSTMTHSGKIELNELDGKLLIQVCGRLHPYETGSTAAMRPVYDLLAASGVEKVIIGGAVGSLDKNISPGNIVQVRDHIFLSGTSPLTGLPNAFVDMAAAYDPLPGLLSTTYAWTHGPQLETVAEIKALRKMGAQVVGMSMPPETILARYYGMKVVGIASVLNWASGIGTPHSIEEMLAQGAGASAKIVPIIESILDRN